MIIYKNTVKKFIDDISSNIIDEEIDRNFLRVKGYSFLKNEGRSWRNSLGYMERVIQKAGIPDDCGVLIEYIIPYTSNRVDFIVSGKDESGNKNFIIIELKQWEKASSTRKDAVVSTFLHSNPYAESIHPSYQAYSYKMLMKDFNENVDNGSLSPYSCAYLHNYIENNPEPLKEGVYREFFVDSPLFFKHDSEKLADFIKKYVGKGNGEGILYEIEKGRIRPSRKLIDHVCSMFKGNKSFVLIEAQKIAYEKAIDLALRATKKSVLIIKGGPGTGKSVISVNLLAGLLSGEKNVAFVAPNASFRDVVVRSLARENKIVRLKNLFKGSAGFHDTEKETFDVLVVDEAHRLKNELAYQYMGSNQVDDIIKASFVTIFFIDDNQRIRPEDIGTVEELKLVARKHNADIEEIELTTQFRCSGAEGYISWLDDVFQIRQTANYDGWNRKQFDFQICDNPNDLLSRIKQKNREGFNARLLAGYAWEWTSEKDGNTDAQVADVVIEEHGFSMPWNSRSVRTRWAIEHEGVNQVGCIHTSQGLEFDYVGVIIGKDLRFDTIKCKFSIDWDNYKDMAGKKGLKNNPELLSVLVRNIYKTLMTRAIKGCYVYFCDKDVERYFKERLNAIPAGDQLFLSDAVSEKEQLVIEKDIENEFKYTTHLPVYSLAAACGNFGDGMAVEPEGWVEVSAGRLFRNMFIARAVGNSMEPLIHDGDYCVFRAQVIGSRNNKIVLAQHHTIYDPDIGGKYTVKKYTSKKKINEDGTWEHEEIMLLPLNSEYDPILIKDAEEGEFKVIAEFIKVL